MNEKPTYEELEQRVKKLEKEAKAQASVETHLKFLSSAINQSSEGIAIADLQGNLEFLNEAFAKIHGYSAEEIIGKNLSVFHTPEQMPSVEAANQQIKETGDFKGEIWHVRRNRSIFPAMMHNTLIRDDVGKPIGMLGTLRDITDQKTAEEALYLSFEKYEKTFRMAPIWVVLSSLKDGRYIEINEAFLQTMEYKREEVIGKTSLELNTWVNPQDRERIMTQIKQKGKVRNVEVQRMTRSGKTIDTLFSAEPISLGVEKVMISVTQEITELKQSQQALRESEHKFRELFNSITDLIYTQDMEGRFLTVNAAMHFLFGYDIDEFIGRTGADFMKPESWTSGKAGGLNS